MLRPVARRRSATGSSWFWRARESHIPPCGRNSHFHTILLPLRTLSTVETRRRHVGQWWQLLLVLATSIKTRSSSTRTVRSYCQPLTLTRISLATIVAVITLSLFSTLLRSDLRPVRKPEEKGEDFFPCVISPIGQDGFKKNRFFNPFPETSWRWICDDFHTASDQGISYFVLRIIISSTPELRLRHQESV